MDNHYVFIYSKGSWWLRITTMSECKEYIATTDNI